MPVPERSPRARGSACVDPRELAQGQLDRGIAASSREFSGCHVDSSRTLNRGRNMSGTWAWVRARRSADIFTFLKVIVAGASAAALLGPGIAAAAAPPTFGAEYVSRTLAGGEPFVIYSHGAGDLVYSGHEGTTHIDRTYTTTPGSSCDLRTVTGFLCSYDNQVNIWYSTDRGQNWTKSPGNPAYTGFSDPSLTEDAGNNIYDTGIDLANDALFASSDGGKTWPVGTPQCHDGDRPWPAGGKAGEVFMSTDTVEGEHSIFRGTISGGSLTCSANGIPDSGGQGQSYYDHQTGDLIEGVGFPDGGYGIGVLHNASN